MKNDLYKKLTGITVLMVLWFCLVKFKNKPINDIVFLLAFVFCIFLTYVVKNEKVVLTLVVTVSVSLCVYNFEFIPMYVPALLLIIAHRYLFYYISTDKRKKSRSINMYITLSYLATIINFIYAFFNVNINEEKKISIDTPLSINTLWIFLFFIFLVISTYKNKTKKEDKENLIFMRNIYICAAIGVLVSYCTYILTEYIYDFDAIRLNFTPWISLLLAICFNEDTSLKHLLKKAEMIIVNW